MPIKWDVPIETLEPETVVAPAMRSRIKWDVPIDEDPAAQEPATPTATTAEPGLMQRIGGRFARAGEAFTTKEAYPGESPEMATIRGATDIAALPAGIVWDVAAEGAKGLYRGAKAITPKFVKGAIKGTGDIAEKGISGLLKMVAKIPMLSGKTYGQAAREIVTELPQMLKSEFEKPGTIGGSASPEEKAANAQIIENLLTATGGTGISPIKKGIAAIIKKIVIQPSMAEKGLGKKLFNIVTETANPRQDPTFYRNAIKAAANPEELDKIAKTYTQNGGNLALLSEDLSNRMAALEASARKGASTKIGRVLGGVQPRPAEQSGEALQAAFGKAKKEVGDVYGVEEARLYETTGSAARSAFTTFGKAEGAVPKKTVLGTPLNEKVTASVKEIAKNIGYKLGEEPTASVGIKAGAQPISKQAQAALNEVYNVVQGVGTFDDLLVARRIVKDMVSNWGKGNAFYIGAKNDRDWLMKNVYGRINELQRSEAEKMIGGNAGKVFREALEKNDAFYASSMDALMSVAEGVGMTSTKILANLRSKIPNIGSKNLAKVMAVANQNQQLKPLADELRRSYFDELLYKGTDKDGALDIQKFSENWTNVKKESPEILAVMLNKKDIANIENAIAQYGKKIEPISGYITSDKGVKGVRRILENATTQNNLEEMRQLGFIDEALGLKGEESFQKQALNFGRAKELGMSAETGAVSTTPTSKTGKSLLLQTLLRVPVGAAAGGIGYGLGSIIGPRVATGTGGLFGSVGLAVGGRLGNFLQSPAGNIWLYNTLRKIPSFEKELGFAVLGATGGATAGAIAAPEGQRGEGALAGAVFGGLGLPAAPVIARSAAKGASALASRLRSQSGAVGAGVNPQVSINTVESYMELLDEKMYGVRDKLLRAKKGERQPWSPVKSARIKKI